MRAEVQLVLELLAQTFFPSVLCHVSSTESPRRQQEKEAVA